MRSNSDVPGSTASRSSISWGAIIGGWLFAYAFAMLLYLFGSAIGMTTLATLNRMSTTVAVGTGVWMVTAWVVAAFAGAIFAGRLSGIGDRSTGIMHGTLVWALSGVMTLFFATVQTTGLAAAIGSAGSGIVQAGGAAGSGALQAGQQGANANVSIPEEISTSMTNQIKTQIAEAVAQSPGAQNISQQEVSQTLEQMDQQTFTDISAAVIGGNPEQAREILTNDTTLSGDQVQSLVNGWVGASQTYGEQLQNMGGAAAEQAGDYSSAFLWVLFLCSVLGLAAGAFGGAIGAGMTRRYYEKQPLARSHHEEYPYGDIDDEEKHAGRPPRHQHAV